MKLVERPRRLSEVLNMDDLERLAHRRLPKMIHDAIAGGAGDERTMRANRQAFEKVWLRPRPLADLSHFSQATEICGQRLSTPVLLAPTGMARMADSGAESAVARAAGARGTAFAVSSASSEPIDRVAQQATGPLWYQIYLPPDRAEARRMLDRAAAAGYEVVCITVDTGVMPRRERDVRNRLSVPVSLSPKVIAGGLTRPRWTANFLLGNVGRAGDRSAAAGLFAAKRAYDGFAATIQTMSMPTWDDIEWVREHWAGKLVIKGVMRGDECGRLIELGVDGIGVSNHGGRNQDGVRPALEILPEVVAAVDRRAEVYIDGGVRRGSDVLKALALGADACLIGRPYLWGLAAAGEEGVAFVIDFFKAEIERAMRLCGCATVTDIDSTLVTAAPEISVPRQ